MGIAMVALLFTFSRAGWVGFMISSLCIPIFIPKVRVYFAGIFISLLMVILMVGGIVNQFEYKFYGGKSKGTIKADVSLDEKLLDRATNIRSMYPRIHLYGAAFRMILDKPVFGSGYGTFKEASLDYFEPIEGIPIMGKGLQLHDTLILSLVELGLVGFSLIIAIFASILVISIRLYFLLPKENTLGKILVISFWGAFIVYFVKNQFSDIRLFVFPNALFYLFSGIICGYYQRSLLNCKLDNKQIPDEIYMDFAGKSETKQ